ncbi:MAG: AAA family ATPase [Thermoanaerobacteraceae bacterium]|nr:AAA family ATPase [Thermoanaerobacteraceae bacterium]
MDINLYVSESLPEDKGKDIARMDPEDMRSIGVDNGDFIIVRGKTYTALRVFAIGPEFRRLGLIQVDSIVRDNIAVGVGGPVTVGKAEVIPLKSILLDKCGLAPDEVPTLEELKDSLKGHCAVISNKIPLVLYSGRVIYLRVQGMAPSCEVGLITGETEIILVDYSLESGRERVSYEDIGGLKEEIKKVRELVELPLTRPDIFKRLGIEAPKGLLLYGPPGTGKTLIARAVASETRAYFIAVNGPEIMNKYYGESEARLREIFDEAKKNAPSIIFIDELDAVAPKRSEVIGDVEKRVVAQLLSLMDGLKSRGDVIVIGATNMPELLDPALRRPGRFDREITIGVPGTQDREEILRIHTRGMMLSSDVSLKKLSEITHGYTGADLAEMCKEAGIYAVERFMDSHGEISNITVNMEDFLNAYKVIEPSALREMIVEVPTVSFKDVGGYMDIKRMLEEQVKLPVMHPKMYEEMGLKRSINILFHGLSGLGKTLMAYAIAKETGLNLINITVPYLLMNRRGIEHAVNEVFKLSKRVSPCILLFDRIDGMVAVGGKRFTNQLILEIDESKNIGNVIIAITNRIDELDDSLIGPTRFDGIIEFKPPEKDDRVEILKLFLKDIPGGENIRIEYLADMTEGLTGADIKGIVNSACYRALYKKIKGGGDGELTEELIIEALESFKTN